MRHSTILASALLAMAALAPATAMSTSQQMPRAAHHDLAALLPLPAARQLIESASHGTAEATSVFRGPDGLTGVVIHAGPGPMGRNIGWATAHGDALLINGRLLGRDGEDLTREAMYQQGLLLSPGKALAQAMSPASRPILVGSRGPVVTVFFDPNCIFCHLLHGALAPLVDAGKLRVRYIVVGTLKDTSIPRATSILMAADPARALAKDESDFDKGKEEGGYPIAATLDPAIKQAVIDNNELFGRAGAHGTPAMLFCTKGSKKAQMHEGMPQDLNKFVADLDDESRCLTSEETP